jgi:hypothetical protein
VPLSAWGDPDEAERALRVAYQARLRELRGSVEWLHRRIAEYRRERDDVLVAAYSEERRWYQEQVRRMRHILDLIDARRAAEDKYDVDWW